MSDKKFLLIYHMEDNDGVCSAAIMVDYLKRILHETNIELLPSTYNSIAELFAREDIDEYLAQFTDVIMTDISANDYKHMLKLKATFGNRFTWVDHHAPIINASFEHKFDDVNGYRDTKHSAIMNMWTYLYDPLQENHYGRPLVFRYLSGWDSWSWESEDLEFNEVQYVNVAFTKMSKLNIDWYLARMEPFLSSQDFNAVTIKGAYTMGEEIIAELDAANKRLMDFGCELTWHVDGRTAGAIVTSGGTNSQMFKSVKDKIQNGIAFKRNANGTWAVSLYNTNDGDDFHCGNYLKEHYKGGGHAGAAGATLKESQFIKILKNKEL